MFGPFYLFVFYLFVDLHMLFLYYFPDMINFLTVFTCSSLNISEQLLLILF